MAEIAEVCGSGRGCSEWSRCSMLQHLVLMPVLENVPCNYKTKVFWLNRRASHRQGSCMGIGLRPTRTNHHHARIQVFFLFFFFFGGGGVIGNPPTAVCNLFLLVNLPRTLQQFGSAPEIPVRPPPPLLNVRNPPLLNPGSAPDHHHLLAKLRWPI